MYGGVGDDLLQGVLGSNFLEGDDGNDRLKGNRGRDILFGGAGMDVLLAVQDENVLFGGIYRYSGDVDAVTGQMAEGSRRDLNYAARVQRLMAGQGLAANFALSLENLIDDPARDQTPR